MDYTRAEPGVANTYPYLLCRRRAAIRRVYVSKLRDAVEMQQSTHTGEAMTPDRIAQIYADETGFDINQEPAALEDFAKKMYNVGWHRGWAAGFACAAMTSLFSLMFYFIWMQYGPQFIEWIQYGHHNG